MAGKKPKGISRRVTIRMPRKTQIVGITAIGEARRHIHEQAAQMLVGMYNYHMLFLL